MKKNIILLLINVTFAFAQYPVLSNTFLEEPSDFFKHTNNGNYAIDSANERDQYVGLWEYNTPELLFQIKMVKVDKSFSGVIYNGELIGNYYYFDVVKVRYKLIRNGEVLFDNLDADINTILERGVKYGEDNFLSGSIIDEVKNVGLRYEITKNPASNPETITFKANPSNYYLLNPLDTYIKGERLIYIPLEEIVMTKID